MGNCCGTTLEPQDYEELKEFCIARDVLFEDDQFSAKLSSLYKSTPLEGIKGREKKIKWLRPSEITQNPQFISHGISRFDVLQGSLGNCWLLGAMANLAMHKSLFRHVVPEDNSFNDEDYCGIFHFRFWQYGRWIDVVIDDRLPSIDGKLIFARSEEGCEFWSALLEKAYAKLHGSYEIIETGPSAESLEDFTGGIVVKFELKYFRDDPFDKEKLFADIKFSLDYGSIANCSTDSKVDRTSQGILSGHAYSVTGAKILNTGGTQTTRLLRIRNPWGNKVEWTGAWSDRSPEWKNVPDTVKKSLDLTFDPDGEFWISFEDFKEQFDRIDICYLSPYMTECVWDEEESQSGASILKRKLETKIIDGKWLKGINKTGKTPAALAKNPKYIAELKTPDEKDKNGMCTMIAAIMQKDRRSWIKDEKIPKLRLHIFKIDVDCVPEQASHKNFNLSAMFFEKRQEAKKDEAVNQGREHILHCRLPVGLYCLVPSTEILDGEFLIRIFTETTISVVEQT